MAQLEIVLEKQVLVIRNQEVIASGDKNYDACVFSFDESWSGYVKTAVFYQDKGNVQYAVLDGGGKCMIPSPAMSREGNMYIGVFGVSGSKVLTSTVGRIHIRQGAVSGDTISTEPADDVFLAIIAQYQRILELMQEYDAAAAELNVRIAEQNNILEALNAFDVVEIMEKLEIIEDRMASYVNMAKEILSREIILRDVPINFSDQVCRVYDDNITAHSLCDVYFDEYSYEIAAKALILPVSFDGYLEISSSINITEGLTANILVRRC